MRVPVVQGTIDRRILVTYRVDPVMMARLLPSPFRPKLAGLASDRELNAELALLEASFQEWRAGRISPYELSDRIHAFHQGPSRHLYVLYTRLKPAPSWSREPARRRTAAG